MRRRAFIGLAIACLAASRAAAFVILAPATRWPSGQFTVQVEINHPSLLANSPTGGSWNAAFAEAAVRWNAASGGLLALAANTGSFEDPCDPNDPPGGDGIHGVGFTAKVCGNDFGTGVLAVARRTFRSGGLVTEANIVFKDSVNWDVYGGNLRPAQRDFRRVAVHEIGHLFGLGHESLLPAIMDPFTGDLEAPQLDDLNGIDAIYQLACPVVLNTGAGSQAGSLAVTDCFDTEVGLALPQLVGLGNDPDPNSFVDLFRVTLASPTTLGVTLSTSAFNPVIQVVDTALNGELASGWGVPGTPASVSKVLAAGSYVVVVRSIFEGSGGSYTLDLVPEPGGPQLGAAALVALAVLQRLRRRSGQTRYLRANTNRE